MKIALPAIVLLTCFMLQGCDRRESDGHSSTPPAEGVATQAPADAPADASTDAAPASLPTPAVSPSPAAADPAATPQMGEAKAMHQDQAPTPAENGSPVPAPDEPEVADR